MFADPSTIITTAFAVFTAIAVLMVGVVGFLVIGDFFHRTDGTFKSKKDADDDWVETQTDMHSPWGREWGGDNKK